MDRGNAVQLQCSVSGSSTHDIAVDLLDHSGTVVASQTNTAGTGPGLLTHNVTVDNSSFAGVYTCRTMETSTPFTMMSDTFTINLNPYFSVNEGDFLVDEAGRLFLTATNGGSLSITCIVDSFPLGSVSLLAGDGYELLQSGTNVLEEVLNPITAEDQGGFYCLSQIDPSIRLNFTIYSKCIKNN